MTEVSSSSPQSVFTQRSSSTSAIPTSLLPIRDSLHTNLSNDDQLYNKTQLLKNDSEGNTTQIVDDDEAVDLSDKRLVINEDEEETDDDSSPNGGVPYDGRLLYDRDGVVFVVPSGDSVASTSFDALLPDAPASTPLTEVRVFSSDGGVQCFAPVPLDNLAHTSSDDADKLSDSTLPCALQLTLCLPCQLDFDSSVASLVTHAAGVHQAIGADNATSVAKNRRLSVVSMLMTDSGGLQALKPTNDPKETPSLPSTTTATTELSSEDLARNLRMAQELSASRLLQQVSKNALAMHTGSSPLQTAVSCYPPMPLPTPPVPGCPHHQYGVGDGGKTSSSSAGGPATNNNNCISCDLANACRQSLSGQNTAMMHPSITNRNTNKTLKCPKCNWHYKYQETLEIHMKEKHSDAEVTCLYCMQNRPHPKLSRGETYNCGYKPYRCDVCKYSTTTKGNLSIHMQSDKHLNNMQELQQNNKMIDPVSLIHADAPCSSAPPAAATTPAAPHSASPNTPPQSSNQQSTAATAAATPTPFRCDVCNYETAIPRNLRIHMTSEKHTQNMICLQRKLSSGGGGMAPDCGNPLVSDAFGGIGLIGAMPPGVAEQLNANNQMRLSERFTMSLFQCCVCMSYGCDTLEELVGHVEADRSLTAPADVSLVAGNFVCNLCQYRTHLKANFQLHTKTDKHMQKLQLVNHVREGGVVNEWRLQYANSNNPIQLRCNACSEFFTSWHKVQLHSFSPRHQCQAKALTLRLRQEPGKHQQFVCTSCRFCHSDPIAVLSHFQTAEHFQNSQHLIDCDANFDLVDIEEKTTQANQKSDTGDETDSKLKKDPKEEQEESDEDQPNDSADPRWSLDVEASLKDAVHCCSLCDFVCKTSMELDSHSLSAHNIAVGDNKAILLGGDEDQMTPMDVDMPCDVCPLCQFDCGDDYETLETHLAQVHNVPSSGVRRLLSLLPVANQKSDLPKCPSSVGALTSPPASVAADSTTPEAASSFKPPDELAGGEEANDSSQPPSSTACAMPPNCPVCRASFATTTELYVHQADSGHLVETTKRRRQPSTTDDDDGDNDDDDEAIFVCVFKDCKEECRSIAAVQAHVKAAHSSAKAPTPSATPTSSDVVGGVVSDRHVYKYRCSQCSLAFRTQEKLDAHSLYHVMRAATRCSVCQRNFRTLSALHSHMERSHQSVETKSEMDLNANHDAENTSNTNENMEDSTEADENLEFLNSTEVAEQFFSDPTRKFKCQKCKIAFTHQSFMISHQKSLMHRRNEKPNYSMEKYLDPNRPFKCEICKESFTQKNILLVHFNSVSHLHKTKKFLELQASTMNVSPEVLAALNKGQNLTMHGSGQNAPTSGSQGEKTRSMNENNSPGNQTTTAQGSSNNTSNSKPYRCNICRHSFGQASTMDVHLRSVAHQSRAAKLPELVAAGEVDLNQPLIKQPDNMGPSTAQNAASKQLINDIIGAAGTNSGSGRNRSSHQSAAAAVAVTAAPALPMSLPGAPRFAMMMDHDQLNQPLNDSSAAALMLNMMNMAQMFPFFAAQMQQQQQQQQDQTMMLPPPPQLVPPHSLPTNSTSASLSPAVFTCTRCPSIFSSYDAQKQHELNVCKQTPSAVVKVESVGVEPDADDAAKPGGAVGNTSKTSTAFKQLLQNYGFEVVMQFNETMQQRKRKRPSADDSQSNNCSAEEANTDVKSVSEVGKLICVECKKEFSGVWVLKAHLEQEHQCTIPMELVEKMSEELLDTFKDEVAGVKERALESLNVANEASNEPSLNSMETNDENRSSQSTPAVESKIKQTETMKIAEPNQSPSKPKCEPSTVTSSSAAQPTSSSVTTFPNLPTMNNTLPNVSGGFPMLPFLGASGGFTSPPFGFPNPFLPMMFQQPPMSSSFDLSALGLIPTTSNTATVSSAAMSDFMRTIVTSTTSVPSMSIPTPSGGIQGSSGVLVPPPTTMPFVPNSQSPQKRARTRITDEQLKVLREYFDITNSPTEQHIEDMSYKAGLPQKVIKHWFRNTLFKERQRNKDSPYNFSIPPSMGIDLDVYERTGVANVTQLNAEEQAQATTAVSTASANMKTNIPLDVQKTPTDTTNMVKEPPPAEIVTEPTLHELSATPERPATALDAEKQPAAKFQAELQSTSVNSAESLTNPFSAIAAVVSRAQQQQQQQQIHPAAATSMASAEAALAAAFLGANPLFTAQEALRRLTMPPAQMAMLAAASATPSTTGANNNPFTNMLFQQQLPPPATTMTTTMQTSSSLPLNSSQQSATAIGVTANDLNNTHYEAMSTTPTPTLNSNNSSDAMTSLIANAMAPGGSGGMNLGPGRRANRTRFTDFQLKALQEFFEKQAYPKDDDLEFLSKKLQLSPRVIVVWFQNARQKARKIYENQPQVENGERFMKTPGSNFQCRRCAQVFQRYYELIQHQHKECYKDDTAAIERENEADGQRAEDGARAVSAAAFFCDKCRLSFNSAAHFDEHRKVHESNPQLFLDESNRKRTVAQMVGGANNSSSGDDDYSNSGTSPEPLSLVDAKRVKLESSEEPDAGSLAGQSSIRTSNKVREFNKRCPFCGILFHSKSSLKSHMPLRHPEQCSKTTVNIDLLPEAEEVPTITTTSVADCGITLPQSLLSFGLLGSNSNFNPSMDANMKLNDESGANNNTPLDLSHPAKTTSSSSSSAFADTNRQQQPQRNGGITTVCPSPAHTGGGSLFGGERGGGDMEEHSDNEDDDGCSSFSSPSPHGANTTQGGQTPNSSLIIGSPGGGSLRGRFRGGGSASSSKRFRTHLTPLQVQVMKALFHEYKTPSMAECEQLGVEIGLHKRVVQVWFQNARAKERKAKAASTTTPPGCGKEQDDLSSTNLVMCPASSVCKLCSVVYTAKTTMQDHVFSAGHLSRVKSHLKSQGMTELTVADDGASNAGGGMSGGARVGGSPTAVSNRVTPGGGSGGTTEDFSSLMADNIVDTYHSHQRRTTTAAKTPKKAAAPPMVTGSGGGAVVDNAAAVAAVDQQQRAAVADFASLGMMQQFMNPFLMGFAGAGGVPMPAPSSSPAAAAMLYDPNLHGTPVTMLQIPPPVMRHICERLQSATADRCVFTQDGKSLDELAANVTDRDFRCAVAKDLEVGWACAACQTVFQQESLFENHCRLICHSVRPVFRLIQSHYECQPCHVRFGTQMEFKKHCELAEHIRQRETSLSSS